MTQDGMPKKLIFQKIENLQQELEKNPRSLSFPLLADLYINENMLDEAQTLIERGLKFYPYSVSGLLVFARLLKLKSQLEQAEEKLSTAIKLAPENWQAFLMRADLYLKLGQARQALADFRKVLVFNPSQPQARKAVAKLDMLEKNGDLNRKFHSISEHQHQEKSDLNADKPHQEKTNVNPIDPKLDRVLSVVDAFSSRQEYTKALKLIIECKTEFGSHPEIDSRLLRLSSYETAEKLTPKTQFSHTNSEPQMSEARRLLILEKKSKVLKLLLRRINPKTHSQLVTD